MLLHVCIYNQWLLLCMLQKPPTENTILSVTDKTKAN